MIFNRKNLIKDEVNKPIIYRNKKNFEPYFIEINFNDDIFFLKDITCEKYFISIPKDNKEYEFENYFEASQFFEEEKYKRDFIKKTIELLQRDLHPFITGKISFTFEIYGKTLIRGIEQLKANYNKIQENNFFDGIISNYLIKEYNGIIKDNTKGIILKNNNRFELYFPVNQIEIHKKLKINKNHFIHKNPGIYKNKLEKIVTDYFNSLYLNQEYEIKHNIKNFILSEIKNNANDFICTIKKIDSEFYEEKDN